MGQSSAHVEKDDARIADELFCALDEAFSFKSIKERATKVWREARNC